MCYHFSLLFILFFLPSFMSLIRKCSTIARTNTVLRGARGMHRRRLCWGKHDRAMQECWVSLPLLSRLYVMMNNEFAFHFLQLFIHLRINWNLIGNGTCFLAFICLTLPGASNYVCFHIPKGVLMDSSAQIYDLCGLLWNARNERDCAVNWWCFNWRAHKLTWWLFHVCLFSSLQKTWIGFGAPSRPAGC